MEETQKVNIKQEEESETPLYLQHIEEYVEYLQSKEENDNKSNEGQPLEEQQCRKL